MYKTLKIKVFEAWVAALKTTLPTAINFTDFYDLPDEDRARIVEKFEDWWKDRDPSNMESKNYNCQVCGVSVFNGVIGYNYMVTKEVWEKEAGFQYDQFAHLACLEYKINRKLTIDDFYESSINGLILWMLEQGIEIPRT